MGYIWKGNCEKALRTLHILYAGPLHFSCFFNCHGCLSRISQRYLCSAHYHMTLFFMTLINSMHSTNFIYVYCAVYTLTSILWKLQGPFKEPFIKRKQFRNVTYCWLALKANSPLQVAWIACKKTHLQLLYLRVCTASVLDDPARIDI